MILTAARHVFLWRSCANTSSMPLSAPPAARAAAWKAATSARVAASNQKCRPEPGCGVTGVSVWPSRSTTRRVIRDIQRKLPTISEDARSEMVLWVNRAERLHRQRPKDNERPYELHAPEVECISKGKSRNPYEFGVKLGLAIKGEARSDRRCAQRPRQSLRRRYAGSATGTGRDPDAAQAQVGDR